MARQGISMTNRCKFGHGNRRLAPSARGTSSGSNPMAVAALMRICGPQRKRTQRSTKRSEWEGRASRLRRRLSRCRLQEPTVTDGITSPVSGRWHAEKAMEVNLGGRMTSGTKPIALPISSKDGTAGDAPCGVGWAHSIDEVRDSTTLTERRGPTCGQGRSEPMEGAIARKG